MWPDSISSCSKRWSPKAIPNVIFGCIYLAGGKWNMKIKKTNKKQKQNTKTNKQTKTKQKKGKLYQCSCCPLTGASLLWQITSRFWLSQLWECDIITRLFMHTNFPCSPMHCTCVSLLRNVNSMQWHLKVGSSLDVSWKLFYFVADISEEPSKKKAKLLNGDEAHDASVSCDMAMAQPFVLPHTFIKG